MNSYAMRTIFLALGFMIAFASAGCKSGPRCLDCPSHSKQKKKNKRGVVDNRNLIFLSPGNYRELPGQFI